MIGMCVVDDVFLINEPQKKWKGAADAESKHSDETDLGLGVPVKLLGLDYY